MEIVSLNQLFKMDHSRAISADDEVDVLELGEDLRNDSDQKVKSLTVL